MGWISHRGIIRTCSSVILILLAFSIFQRTIRILTVRWVDQQVKGIVVENKLITISFRHRTPGLQTTVVLACLIISATIEILIRFGDGSCAIISRLDIVLDFLLQFIVVTSTRDKGSLLACRHP